MAAKIIILVGTMTGTAQLCAQEMELALDDGEHRVETLLMDQLDSSVFSREGVFLICTSTYGQGDVPDNAKALYDDLRARRPNLSGVRYGVFGLGDRTYAETFNFGGKRFDDLLAEPPARLTKQTRDATALRTEFATIRDQGIATERDEAVLGESSVAAPIFDHAGTAVGAIGVVDATERVFPRELAKGLGAAVSEAARGVSRELGAPRWPHAAEA